MATSNGVKSSKPEAERRPPVHTIRCGWLRASIWRHESAKGPFLTATLSRSFRDDEGTWQNFHDYGRRDLLEAAKLLNEAHTWISRQEAKLRAENGQGNDAERNEEDIPF
jgi:hypothetical protein